ncbi:hypothetical protein H6G01_01670 [Leptolyngbya sp. FACHB-17]|uniref:hypothetical protein n=2 Tax=unclassified Leptolyngbya TaxID=2650499 RepID=UPI001680CD3B|nr:hypothetical protein [Leptolyngbya sp. FACHB-17]
MPCSMEDYLNVVVPYLPSELVSDSALSNIRALSKVLPPFSLAGFESRLGTAQPVVDLLVRFPRLKLPLPQAFLAHSAWRSLHNLCQAWVQPSSELYDQLQHIWLEFDLDRPPASVPIPCLFLSLSDTVKDARSLVKLAHRLPEHTISASIAANLTRCAHALPANARIEHLGAMLSRPNQAIRVVVSGIRLQQIPEYLTKIGWHDSTNRLTALISNLLERVDSVAILDLDVGEQILPKIGIECFNRQPSPHPRQQQFLDYLVGQELCTLEKQAAIAQWTGLSQNIPQNDAAPTNLMWGDLFLRGKAHSIFWRSVSHIKLSYQPEQPLDAKAYLAFGHNWFDASVPLSA